MRLSIFWMLIPSVMIAPACGGDVVVDPDDQAAGAASATGGAPREECGELLCEVGERCCTPCMAPLQQVCVAEDEPCPGPGPACV